MKIPPVTCVKGLLKGELFTASKLVSVTCVIGFVAFSTMFKAIGYSCEPLAHSRS